MWRERLAAGRRRIHELDLEPARYLNLGLASWLLVSAYVWRHSEPQFLVTVFLGAVIAVIAPFDLDLPMVRKLNMAAGAGLVLAALVFPRASALVLWNNVIVGLLIAGISFFGPPHGAVPRRLPAPDDAYEGVGL